MIYLLYANNHKNNQDVFIGMSTDFEFIKNLADKIPYGVKYRYPIIKIYGYENNTQSDINFDYSPCQQPAVIWYKPIHKNQWYDRTKTVIKFRPHKELLEETMTKLQIFATGSDLLEYLNNEYSYVPNLKDRLTVEWYCYDNRINWNTYIVHISDFGVIGFTNSPVNTKFITLTRKKCKHNNISSEPETYHITWNDLNKNNETDNKEKC